MRMQLDPARQNSPLREKLGKAALAAILLDLPAAAAHADTNPPAATTQIDISTLLYGEQNRARVFEPFVQATRLFPDGQSLSLQFGLDVITGASPTGALPSGSIETSTTPSGQVVIVPAGEIPVSRFQDQRFGFDGGWTKPLSREITSVLGGHFSHEKDYQSVGINEKFSFDLFRKTLTLAAGAGANFDSVSPTGGTPDPLSDGVILHAGSNSKHVTNLVLGLSRVLSRRWIASVDASMTFERGYLTEPYKVISAVDPLTGLPAAELTDSRPDSRNRTSLLFSSVYHLTNDVLYVTYRYYWDDWNLNSNTFDVKYRHEIGDSSYLEPHVRYYHQNAASFYVVNLISDAPLPDFATSDYRLGKLNTVTAGATFGFRPDGSSNEWNIRGEFIRQTGNGHPPGLIGVEQNINLFPPLNIFEVIVGYSFNF